MTSCGCIELWERSLDHTTVKPTTGEQKMLRPLLSWLNETRRVMPDTHVALELSWFGRRIDLATLTRTGRTVAYELKLASVGRALEQAAYNRIAFDRSYVVTESMPRPDNVALAAESGVGLILVRSGEIRCLLGSPLQRPMPNIRSRLLRQLRSVGCLDDV